LVPKAEPLAEVKGPSRKSGQPVSTVDVSIRAGILSLLQPMRQERDITILNTTHDLATAGYFPDRMAIMYLGCIVELGPTTRMLR
jgi:peptide/nickel transport system ATP-binding protein